MFEKIDVWYIECSTGCTCCSYENFDQGFYKNEEDANLIANNYRNGVENPLASQYAKYGHYKVTKAEAELLPDGRIIINDNVFSVEQIGNKHIYW